MTTEAPDPLEHAARQAADGVPPSEGQVGADDPAAAGTLESLGVLARVAQVHRAMSPREGTSSEAASEAAETQPVSPLIQWGPLTILEWLDAGSFGDVYRALDPTLGREVALKLRSLEASGGGGAQRWLDEGRRLALVHHPNIVQIYGAAIHDGRPGMWMELVRGETLERQLEQRGTLGWREACTIGIELCGALAAVHAAGCVHQDVKTSNVMREGGPQHPRGASGRIVLMDFGAAQRFDPGVGATFATPLSCAPEVLAGGAPTPRSDLYSLGVLLYRLVTARYPIEGASTSEIITIARTRGPVPLRDLRPDVSLAFASAIERVLDPDPARRWASAGEFERALVATLSGAPADDAPMPEPRQGSRVRRIAGWAVGAIVVLIAAAFGLREWWSRSHAPHASAGSKPEWILVADFDGPSNDPDLAPAARQLVSAAFDQSGIFATVPPSDVRIALKAAGKPDSTRLTPAVARELAYRRSIKGVLEGSVRPIGDRFSVVLSLRDADRDSLLLTEQATARDKNDLIPALDGVARRLRTALGENPSAVRATRMLLDFQTPSFEAFRLGVEGRRFFDAGDLLTAIDYGRRALLLDPDFAVRIDVMTGAFLDLGMFDSARVYAARGAKIKGRRSEDQELFIEAFRAGMEHGNEAELAAWSRMAQRFPNNDIGHANTGELLWILGRHEEALAETRRAIALMPFGPDVLELSNAFDALVALGRLKEAAALVDTIRALEAPAHDVSDLERLTLALAAGRWGSADSLGERMEREPTLRPQTRITASMARSTALGARGELRAAESELAGLAPSCVAADDMIHLHMASRSRSMLQLLAPWLARHRPERPDTSLSATISRGLARAAQGDWTQARACLAQVRAQPQRARMIAGDAPAVLEAVIASHDGRGPAAIGLLGPPARRGYEDAYEVGIGVGNVREQLASAFEASGRPDSALVYQSLVAQRYAMNGDGFPTATLPLVELRIIANALRCGQIDLAERTWERMSHDVDRPDPELSRLMDQEEKALSSARAMQGRP